MPSKTKKVQPVQKPCDLIIFGIKGDLARRKLLPSLYQLEKAELLHLETKIICAARSEIADIGGLVWNYLEKFLKEPIDKEVFEKLSQRLAYQALDFKNADSYQSLRGLIPDGDRVLIAYAATSHSIYGPICVGLSKAGLNTYNTRIVLEKPIGYDLQSSQKVNEEVSVYFEEEQIYRIDHYLGKETVLNLLALRFANAIFSQNWDHSCIDHVQITIAEEVGIEGRWGYFDSAGQMRDMVQNHLLQILTLIAMEPPVNLDADAIRDEKLKVLKALRPITIENVREMAVRGQYNSGFVRGQRVPGYLEEPKANPESQTETFVALRVDIDNWRWAGVPFYLRTGKRLPVKSSEVVIHFKPQPHNIFYKTHRNLEANKLSIRLQPDEGIEIRILNKQPGLGNGMRLQQNKLDLSFSETYKKRIADAYERLLLEVMLGDQALFVHRNEVEEAWKWVDSIIDAWEQSNEPPKSYQAGTWGPTASIAMITRDGRSWDEG